MKVSIISISFNNENDIRPTLESVISQIYSNIEYIVVDGASTDNTLSIINEYKSDIDCIISEPDNGMYDAINKGIKKATGDVIGLIHAGDRLFDSTVIEKIAGHFKQYDIDAMYGHSYLVKEKDVPVRINRSPEFKRSLFKFGWMPSHQSVYIKREVFDKLGYYRLDLGGSADYEFVLRYFYFGKLKVKRLDEYIIRFAMGGRSTSDYRKTLIVSQKKHIQGWKLNGDNPPFYFIPFKLLRKIKQYILAMNRRLSGR